MKDERDGQFYCIRCRLPIGLSGQPAAYSSMLELGSLCPKHYDYEAKDIKREPPPPKASPTGTNSAGSLR